MLWGGGGCSYVYLPSSRRSGSCLFRDKEVEDGEVKVRVFNISLMSRLKGNKERWVICGS